jgi:hypothetical protein
MSDVAGQATVAEVDPRFALPRTLFFGIGAQKSGTSWLSNYLADHPDVYMSRRKELHYWSVVRPPHDRFPRKRRERDLRTASAQASGFLRVAKGLSGGAAAIDEIARRTIYARIYDDTEPPYRSYADALFHDYDGQSVAGEFTPAYARLKPHTFAEIARLAPDVRFVFLMRAPVARLVSGIRHGLRAEVGPENVTRAMVEDRVREALRGGSARDLERSRYDLSISRLESVVPRARIFYAFYEELFDQSVIDDFCRFLGVALRPADFSRQVNVAADNAGAPGQDVLREARLALAPVYEFVQHHLGRVPAAWRADMEGEPWTANSKTL